MAVQTAMLEPLAPPDGLRETVPGPTWRFEVLGEAAPQGSFKAIQSRTTGRPMLKASNETQLNRWRRHVAKVADACRPPWLRSPIDGPVWICLVVVRERSPRDYLADGRTLRKGARKYPDTAPDNDKLERAIFDALTGIAFVNDGRVVSNLTVTRYAELGESARVIIEVTELP